MMRAALLVVALWLALAGAAAAEPRVALVIGNSSYGGDLGQLPNPANDAKLMAKTLRGIGFTVVETENANQAQMKRAIQDFSAALATSGSGATGLFFYAGHGLQVAGTNYLIPINAKIAREADVDIEAVPVDLVMKQMAFAESAVNIVILDACRNNPLSRGFRSITRGLADPTVRPMGSFIAYSTAPGDVAEDGKGANSPYTTALAEAIAKPGASINDVFQEVRGKVLAATDKKQIPWDSSSLTAPFYFVPAPVTPPPVSNAVDAQAMDLAFWNAVKDSESADDYQAYLDKFPDGVFAPLAKLRLKQSDQTAARVLHQDPAAAPAGQSDASAFETAFWNAVEDDHARDGYQAYLSKYPNGIYADLAGRRLAQLDAKPEASTQQASVAPPRSPLPEIVATTAKLYAKDKARLRDQPAGDAAIVARLAANTALDATGRSADGAWWRVMRADGKAGFVSASAVTDQAPPVAAPPVAPVAAAPAPSAAPAAKTPEPETSAAAAVPAGQEHDICLKSSDDRPSGEMVVACRRLLAAGIADVDDRYNAEIHLANALVALGKNDEAMDAYRTAVDIDPKYFSAYDGIGSIHMSAGRYAEARRAFDKAVSLSPDDAYSLYQRGTALTYLGEFEDARNDLKRAIKLKSDDVAYYDQLAAVDMARGDLDAALTDADAAVSVDSGYWGGGAMLVYYLAGKFDRTVAMAEAGMKDQPAYAYFYIWKALARRGAGDTAAASAALAEGAKALGNKDWPLPLIDFLDGRIPESRLRSLAASGGAKVQSERVCEIDFYVAEVAYLAGDKAAAKAGYQAAVGSRIYHYLEFGAAKARLAQLNR